MSFPNGNSIPRNQALVDNHQDAGRRGSTGNLQMAQHKRCLRCNSEDRFWRSCPHPFRPEQYTGNASRPNQKNNAPRTESSSSKTVLIAEPAIEEVSDDPPAGPPVNVDDVQNQQGFYLDDLIFVRIASGIILFSPQTDITSIVLDTGATSSVCSVDVIRKFFPHLMSDLRPSGKTFRFGDSRKFTSTGRVFFRNRVPLAFDSSDDPNVRGKK